MEKRVLGRGLSALIPNREEKAEVAVGEKTEGQSVLQIPVSSVKENRYQPRLDFDRGKLEDLVNSIRERGVVQPIIVRKSGHGYELIAGERRLRAAKTLGIEKIPAIVRQADDVAALEIALIENIQREDLNAIEEAVAYDRLMSEFSFTQEKISKALGKERSTVANILRLLDLPKKVQDFICANSISAGHGKAILALPSADERTRVAHVVVKRGLSVRETEKLVGRRLSGTKEKKTEVNSDLGALEDELRRLLGTRVAIRAAKKGGKIQIEYYSNDDFDRILGILRAASSKTPAAAAA